MPGAEPKKRTGATGLRSLDELAGELGVPQHILRYWETRFPQLRPLQRAGNRRYYRPDDVALARRIHRLLNQDGYTIRGVQQLLGKGGRAEGEEEATASVATAPTPASQLNEGTISYVGANAGRSSYHREIIRTVCDLLGGVAILGAEPVNALDVHDSIAKGLPGGALVHFIESLPGLRRPEIFEQAVGMSVRTLQRRQEKPHARLSPEQSARLWKLAEILAEASDLLGSLTEAGTWLERPALGLDQRRPIDLLATPSGVGLIEDYLGRLRYGVYA